MKKNIVNVDYVIKHNRVFNKSQEEDLFLLTLPLSYLESQLLVATGVEDIEDIEEDIEDIDYPHINWGDNTLCFGCCGTDIKIDLDLFEDLGLDVLRYWDVEEFDEVYIDWDTDSLVFTYTTTHYLPV